MEPAAAFLRDHPGLFSKLHVSWHESPAGMDAGVSLQLPPAAAAKADPLVEALGRARRRAADPGADAGAHLDLAELLLQAGAGDAARDEARRGVALAPAQAAPLVRLGRVLEHDAFGRRWHPGFDAQGAEAALRQARTLDPAAGVELAAPR